MKGGSIVWTCVEDNIIKEQEKYKAIGLHGFYFKLLEEEEVMGCKKFDW